MEVNTSSTSIKTDDEQNKNTQKPLGDKDMKDFSDGKASKESKSLPSTKHRGKSEIRERDERRKQSKVLKLDNLKYKPIDKSQKLVHDKNKRSRVSSESSSSSESSRSPVQKFRDQRKAMMEKAKKNNKISKEDDQKHSCFSKKKVRVSSSSCTSSDSSQESSHHKTKVSKLQKNIEYVRANKLGVAEKIKKTKKYWPPDRNHKYHVKNKSSDSSSSSDSHESEPSQDGSNKQKDSKVIKDPSKIRVCSQKEGYKKEINKKDVKKRNSSKNVDCSKIKNSTGKPIKDNIEFENNELNDKIKIPEQTKEAAEKVCKVQKPRQPTRKQKKRESSDSSSSSSSSSSGSGSVSSSSESGSTSDISTKSSTKSSITGLSSSASSISERLKRSVKANERTRHSRSPILKSKKKSQAPRPKKLHVGHLTNNINKQHLNEIFGIYGSIINVDLPIDRASGHVSRGFAYVEYDNPDDAENAMRHMNGGFIDGQKITVAPVLLYKSRPLQARRVSPVRRPFPSWRYTQHYHQRSSGGGYHGNRDWRRRNWSPIRRRSVRHRTRSRSPVWKRQVRRRSPISPR